MEMLLQRTRTWPLLSRTLLSSSGYDSSTLAYHNWLQRNMELDLGTKSSHLLIKTRNFTSTRFITWWTQIPKQLSPSQSLQSLPPSGNIFSPANSADSVIRLKLAKHRFLKMIWMLPHTERIQTNCAAKSQLSQNFYKSLKKTKVFCTGISAGTSARSPVSHPRPSKACILCLQGCWETSVQHPLPTYLEIPSFGGSVSYCTFTPHPDI